MALSKPLAAPEGRTMPALAASNAGVLPADAVYEILLRVPAKDLCRFRAVCRPWRSLLSDPHFIAAHAAHHPGPLIVAGCHTTSPEHVGSFATSWTSLGASLSGCAGRPSRTSG
jgi:hypothetical protein